ncbi:MAG: hypothetical protein GTN59_10385 [Candidatus Dadabacteria bacterium]|nr:hypothetical protein [Candidatus Dadabacteria bacterium]
MRVGQREDVIRTQNTPYALIVEDINLDSSCFVMTENQQINFKFSNQFSTFSKLIPPRNEYNSTIRNPDGSFSTPLFNNQIILNSGRIIVNTKLTDVVLSSNRDVVSSAIRDTIIDSGENIYINPDNGKLFLGTVFNLNSVVKYNELAVILNLIKLALRQLASNPMAPSPGVPPLVERMNIGTIKSDVVKIGN